ncbi:hypothetical protein Cgig2_011062 [Carnegiea gigantea]|uniref:Uncharacterized protein n=1 Tax=Carnegiea gigantea TaxID=171969 RepID=A0A9Q1JR00_9CARY|nr:hypothetical protein Cgig2_011062 [Carnegiea gigantea]
MLRHRRLKKPPDPSPVASTAPSKRFQRFPLCFSDSLACNYATDPLDSPSLILVTPCSFTTPNRAPLPISIIHSCFLHPLLHLRMSDEPPDQTQSLSTAPNSSSVSSHNANLLSAPQLSNDGSPSRPQLPADLDGSSPNNPSRKGKEAVPTFSRAVKLGVGSISVGSVSRTRTECHVYPATSNLESMHKATPIGPLTPDIDLPTMRLQEVCAICGSTTHALEACPDSPKNVLEVVVEKFGATTLHPDSVVASPCCGSRSTTPSESWVTVSPKKRSRLPSAHRKQGIWPTPTPKVTADFMRATTPPWYFRTSIQDYDMPIDEDDDMDIFLNLEGDDGPQHSSDSSKKRCLKEDEEHSSSYTCL